MRNEVKTMNKNFSMSMMEYFENVDWPRISARAFTVWSALLFKRIPVVNISSVSFREIKEMTGIGSKATVGRGLDELIEKGYVQMLPLPGANNQPNVYRLLRLYDGGMETVSKSNRVAMERFSEAVHQVIDEACEEAKVGDEECSN